MDDIVKQALAKWPNVPDCYGWLGLDARGNWYMRDDRVQAAGPFANPLAGGSLQSKGSMLKHEKLIDFIQRNYESDASGCWFFQNGPQKVYVELEATPWIWRIGRRSSGDTNHDSNSESTRDSTQNPMGEANPASTDAFEVAAHDGRAAVVQRCVLDEHGRVYLQADIGFGLVHTQDVALAADAVEAGVWVPQDMIASELPQHFGYVTSPQLQHTNASQ